MSSTEKAASPKPPDKKALAMSITWDFERKERLSAKVFFLFGFS